MNIPDDTAEESTVISAAPLPDPIDYTNNLLDDNQIFPVGDRSSLSIIACRLQAIAAANGINAEIHDFLMHSLKSEG